MSLIRAGKQQKCVRNDTAMTSANCLDAHTVALSFHCVHLNMHAQNQSTHHKASSENLNPTSCISLQPYQQKIRKDLFFQQGRKTQADSSAQLIPYSHKIVESAANGMFATCMYGQTNIGLCVLLGLGLLSWPTRCSISKIHWKSRKVMTKAQVAAEPTRCTCNVEACGLSLIKLFLAKKYNYKASSRL